jgi:hypothetical protein
MDQTENNWELLLTGDDCPEFNKLPFRALVNHFCEEAESKGNKIVFSNNDYHTGHCGYQIINEHITAATGKYFMLMSNDDMLLPGHFENYLRIERTVLDWAYFDTWVTPNDAPRNAQLKDGMIGHSELIIKTDFLRTMPPHGPEYGHDWVLVQNMMKATEDYKKALGAPQTYMVMSIPGREEKGID